MEGGQLRVRRAATSLPKLFEAVDTLAQPPATLDTAFYVLDLGVPAGARRAVALSPANLFLPDFSPASIRAALSEDRFFPGGTLVGQRYLSSRYLLGVQIMLRGHVARAALVRTRLWLAEMSDVVQAHPELSLADVRTGVTSSLASQAAWAAAFPCARARPMPVFSRPSDFQTTAIAAQQLSPAVSPSSQTLANLLGSPDRGVSTPVSAASAPSPASHILSWIEPSSAIGRPASAGTPVAEAKREEPADSCPGACAADGREYDDGECATNDLDGKQTLKTLEAAAEDNPCACAEMSPDSVLHFLHAGNEELAHSLYRQRLGQEAPEGKSVKVLWASIAKNKVHKSAEKTWKEDRWNTVVDFWVDKFDKSEAARAAAASAEASGAWRVKANATFRFVWGNDRSRGCNLYGRAVRAAWLMHKSSVSE